jgi:hypothetical protein
MQCVGFVPEMSHFMVRRERIFADQLESGADSLPLPQLGLQVHCHAQ